MKDIALLMGLILFCVVAVGGGWYWNYYACTQKFPDVSWYVCAFSR